MIAEQRDREMFPVNSVQILPTFQLKMKLQCKLMQEPSRVDLLIEHSRRRRSEGVIVRRRRRRRGVGPQSDR